MVKTARFSLRHLHPTAERILSYTLSLLDHNPRAKSLAELRRLIARARQAVIDDTMPKPYKNAVFGVQDLFVSHVLNTLPGNWEAHARSADDLRRVLAPAYTTAQAMRDFRPDPLHWFTAVRTLVDDSLARFQDPACWIASSMKERPAQAVRPGPGGQPESCCADDPAAIAWTIEGALSEAERQRFAGVPTHAPHCFEPLYLSFAIAQAMRAARYDASRPWTCRSHDRATTILRGARHFAERQIGAAGSIL